MKKRKAEKRLDSRRSDFNGFIGTVNAGCGGVTQRKETGGFHKPGSNKKRA